MLRELNIENFALIERVSLEFGPGLTVLTGETGAGKSIIVEALALGLGARADTSVIRAGCDVARVDCLFEIGEEVAGVVAGLGHDTGDRTLVLSRALSSDGRSRCWINGRPATVGALSNVGDLLVDFHGQHEHQRLLKSSTHLGYLDAFGRPETLDALGAYVSARERLLAASDSLHAAALDAEGFAAQLERARVDLQEIDSAEIASADEDERLQVERNRMRNASKLFVSASDALSFLNGAAGGAGGDLGIGAAGRGPGADAASLLARAARSLRSAGELDPQLAAVEETLAGVTAEAAEAASTLKRYLQELSFSEERLSEVEDRLALLKQLKERFGPTLAEVIAARERLASQLEGAEDPERAIAHLKQEVEKAWSALGECGAKLSKARRKSGERLADGVSVHLQELAFARNVFEVRQGSREASEVKASIPEGGADPGALAAGVGAEGLDSVEFYVGLNPGEPVMPLTKVASGGEVSRLMLAVKLALGEGDPVSTLVFDEVDAGVGGHTATAVGGKLARLAGSAQVMCITHLPQIACYADSHILVDKDTASGRTAVRAATLSEDARTAELARMLGGDTESHATLAHARELLTRAESKA